jgi:hypothetical protein
MKKVDKYQVDYYKHKPNISEDKKSVIFKDSITHFFDKDYIIYHSGVQLTKVRFIESRLNGININITYKKISDYYYV